HVDRVAELLCRTWGRVCWRDGKARGDRLAAAVRSAALCAPLDEEPAAAIANLSAVPATGRAGRASAGVLSGYRKRLDLGYSQSDGCAGAQPCRSAAGL